MLYGPYQNEEEFSKLIRIFNNLHPASVLEIGSLHGHTLKEFIKYMEPDSKFTSIDMLVSTQDSRYQEQKAGHDLDWGFYAMEHNVKFQIIEYSSTDTRSFDLVKKFTPSLDFLFIDGDHTYNVAKKDFMTFGSLVRTGGIIALHDISPVEGTSEVSKLWQEIKANHKTEEFMYDSTGKGIGVVYV
jgi:cephalosporin hydroxylase